MQGLINDDPELAAEEVKILGRLRKIAQVEDEKEEILQTKIVPPKKVIKNWPERIPSVQSEAESLTVEKSALKELTKEEVERLREKAQREGKKLEIIPSKLVWC